MKKIEISATVVSHLVEVATTILMVLAFLVLFKGLGMSNLLAIIAAGVSSVAIYCICLFFVCLKN